MPEVCVMGLGYIGLPTAATIASRGMDVLGVDVNPAVVDTINRGEIHIVEPDLDIVVRAAVESGRFRAATAPEAAGVHLIAVPTPFDEDKQPDLSYVVAAGRSVAGVLRGGELVILESTCPVGATEVLRDVMVAARPDLDFVDGEGSVRVAHCPERVLPGKVLRELIENDRVIGGLDAASTAAAVAFYSRFVEGECIATDARTAELAKLTENAFRDVNIAFANELSMICDRMGVDVWELIRLANHHPRVDVLSPGAGVGGHCIAVDPWFIVASAPEESRLIRTAREVNDAKPGFVLERIQERAAELGARTVGLIGLTFKPDVDDLRESPALAIAIETLSSLDCDRILIVEPHLEELPGALATDPRVELVGTDRWSAAELWVGLVRHTSAARSLASARIDRARFLDLVDLLGDD